ncbi:Cytochrome P450 4V2 [Papilio xuthus]|uniref:Cytochrome P450 4V2 n=1 Tax=Papilio xuthus TaxID=66420 RepID=A0A194PZ23_PAPXU|nr:Cytochrome P450 4V2 [Papilio xuthus]
MALFKLKRRRLYRLASKIPGSDDELPFIGLAHKFTGTTEVVVDPVDVEVILKTSLEKDDLHRFIRNVIGNGLIFAPVSIWRRRRKITVPAFSPKIVDTFMEVFAEQSEKLVSVLATCAGNGYIAMEPYLCRYTLDSVCETTMGITTNAQNNPNAPYLKALKNILNLVCERIFHLWLQPDWLYKFFSQSKSHQKYTKEMQDVFGTSDRRIVKEDLSKLKYLERIVKESLRLYPPGPFIIRKVLEDISLPSGRVFPAGSGAAVSIWGLHRDPKYWGPDAEVFDPDRFLPERFNLKHACSYIPFSSGPRNCIGYQYALMSMKTVLSAIVRRYKIMGEESGPVPHIKSKIDIMMKAVDDYKICLEKRFK